MVENNAIIQELAENTVIIQTSMYILHRANIGKKNQSHHKSSGGKHCQHTISGKQRHYTNSGWNQHHHTSSYGKHWHHIQAVLENKAIIHSMLDRHHTSSGEKTPLYKQWWKYIQAMMENSAIMQAVVEIIAVIQAMV